MALRYRVGNTRLATRATGIARGFGVAPFVAAMASILAAPAAANTGRTLVATSSNFNSVLTSARPGDTIQMQGSFNHVVTLQNRNFGGLTIDASGATLTDGLVLRGVQNVNVVGGTIGNTAGNTRNWYAVEIINSSHVSVAHANVVGNNDRVGAGLRLLNSNFTTVRDSSFSGSDFGIHMANSNNNLVTRNQFSNGGSDGIQLVSSQRTIISHNSCTGFTIAPNAHPDCIQMWGQAGMPQVSTIYVLNNYMLGPQQGIFLGGGMTSTNFANMTIAGNFIAGSKSHGISCYGCVNSLLDGNTVVTLPGSPHQTLLRAFGMSPNTQLTDNVVVDLRGRSGPIDQLLPAWTWTDLKPTIGWMVGSQNDSRDWRARAGSAAAFAEPVPEPATWLLLGVGFALIGRQLRAPATGRLRVQLA